MNSKFNYIVKMALERKMKLPEEKTDYKILVSARELFVKHGFSGTSMGKIAMKANVNHSLIFHHFGNKQKLWQAVKDNIIEEGKKLYAHVPETKLQFSDFLEILIKRATDFYKNNPDIVRMINWQRVDIAAGDIIGLNLSPESKEWLEACKHYQTTGDINKKHKPEYVVTMILAVISSLSMDPNNFVNDSKAKEEYTDFCVSTLLSALKV